MITISCTALAIFGLDWIIKRNVKNRCTTASLPMTWAGEHLRINYVRNTGLMLGFGKKHPRLVLLLPAFMVIMLCLLVPALRDAALAARFGYGLLLGGGAGNLVDRLRFGFVTDYLNFPRIKRIRNLYFNLSDFGILIGVFLCCLYF